MDDLGVFVMAVFNLCMCVAYGRQADQSRTFVDEVFGGVLVSTVTCDTCTSVSW